MQISLNAPAKTKITIEFYLHEITISDPYSVYGGLGFCIVIGAGISQTVVRKSISETVLENTLAGSLPEHCRKGAP